MRKFTNIELAEYFFSMTGQVVDSNNCIFLRRGVCVFNSPLISAIDSYRKLQIMVVTGVIGNATIFVTVNNLTGLAPNDINAHMSGSNNLLHPILGYSGVSQNCSFSYEIYSFK